MDMIGRIRRLHTRDKKSVRAIARITGLSRNTVTKWLSEPVDTPPKYQRAEHAGKLAAFQETLRMALKADARRPKHERRTAKALYAQIQSEGYEGGYTTVSDFIRAWRQTEGQSASVSAFDRLTHHCHIVETGNQSIRFSRSKAGATKRIKAREQARRVPTIWDRARTILMT